MNSADRRQEIKRRTVFCMTLPWDPRLTEKRKTQRRGVPRSSSNKPTSMRPSIRWTKTLSIWSSRWKTITRAGKNKYSNNRRRVSSTRRIANHPFANLKIRLSGQNSKCWIYKRYRPRVQSSIETRPEPKSVSSRKPKRENSKKRPEKTIRIRAIRSAKFSKTTSTKSRINEAKQLLVVKSLSQSVAPIRVMILDRMVRQ